jgi:uncharacterized protein (DUF58 family)
MTWNRQYFGAIQTAWVLRIVLLCLVMSLILTQYIAAGIFGFLGTIAFLQSVYFKRVGQTLIFSNDRKRVRMLKGGHSVWELTFENKGYPIWNGQLRLHFQDAVIPRYQKAKQYAQLIEVLVPFTIGTNEKVTVQVPITGEKRGLSRIKQLEITIPHLFGEGSVVLLYNSLVHKEQIVYPNIDQVKEFRHPSALKPGTYEYKHSIFQDVFSPIGTRDYLPSDQFHHIHWKASARMQKFQTKVFTQVANESVMLILNVSHHYSIIADLEEKIEIIASYADYFYREGIPYSLAVNVRSYGRSPYLFLPTGDGQVQRQKTMELLSVLSKNDLTMPFKRMLTHIDMHETLPMAIIIFTHDAVEVTSFVTKWRLQAKVDVFGVIEVGGGTKWKKASLQNH